MRRQFVAEVSSPERRRLFLSHTGIDRSSHGSLEWLGWELVIERLSPQGLALAKWDVWEETMLQALRHGEIYADEPIEWRVLDTNEVVDLRSLQPTFDESLRFATALDTFLSPDGARRVCFNLYDDRHYRFTLEERIVDAELEAWVPTGWSGEQPNLEAARRDAQREFDWFR